MMQQISLYSRLAHRTTLRRLQYSASVRELRTRPTRADRPVLRSNEGREQIQNGEKEQQSTTPTRDVSSALADLDPSQNTLLAPVHIPEDQNAILRSDHPATDILAQSGLVVTRQVEMLNIFLGFEQANKYVIMDPQGNHIGYMAEHDGGIAKTMGRQWFKTHRAFTTHVFDRHAREVLRFHRPFSWINSRIRVYDALEPSNYAPKSHVTALSTSVTTSQTLDGTHAISSLPLEAMRIIGETHSEWAPMRRKYNLYLAHELNPSINEPIAQTIASQSVPNDLSRQQQDQVQSAEFAQFAYVNEQFLSWDFSLKGADGRLLGSVNRNWRGFGREIFTDTGMYVLRMDAAALEDEAQKSHLISQSHRSEQAYAEVVGGDHKSIGMTLDQRALMLATAVTIDFDYFSKLSSHGGGYWMLPLWMGGGGEAAGAGAAGAAGAEAAEAGAVVGGTARGLGGAASEIGAGEGAIAGAGSLAGYEAMQRAREQGGPAEGVDPRDSQSPQSGGDYAQDAQGDPPAQGYGSEYSSTQSSEAPSENDDLWGAGDADPWQDKSPGSGSGEGGGEEGGGIISSLWESFFGD